MFLYLLPFISALIGWLTNWVAIKMLFHPRYPTKILGITFHGIFPKHQSDIAIRIGKMISEELISASDVKEHINQPDKLDQLKVLIEDKIDDYLNQRFPQKHPVLSMFLNDARKKELKGEMMVEVDEAAPQMINQYVDHIERDFDVAEIVTSRVAKLEVDKLEQLMMSILSREFRFVEYIGGVIGFVIGLFQLLLIKLG